MRQPKVTEMLDGRMYIFDDAFEPPELNELVRDVQNWPYLYGEVDDGPDTEFTQVVDVDNVPTAPFDIKAPAPAVT